MIKAILLGSAAIAISACAALRDSQPMADRIARVNPASVAASPAAWDGREVEMVGLLVWEFENLGLYQSYGTYCRRGEKTAVYVPWDSWAGVTRADNRRRVIVRGTFRNKIGVAQPDGSILISNAAPGPGPLEQGRIVRWLSAPLKSCPVTR